jgi:hypothetical protein
MLPSEGSPRLAGKQLKEAGGDGLGVLVEDAEEADAELREPGDEEEEVGQEEEGEEEPVRVRIRGVLQGREVGRAARSYIDHACVQSDQSHQMRLSLQSIHWLVMIRTVLQMKIQAYRHQRHHDQCLELRGRHLKEDSGRDHPYLPECDQDLPVEVARMKASIEELVLPPYLFELGHILLAQARSL